MGKGNQQLIFISTMYLLTNYPTLHPTPRLRWVTEFRRVTKVIDLPDGKQIARIETLLVDVCIALLKPASRAVETWNIPGVRLSFASKHWRRRSQQINRFQKFHMFRMQTQQRDALSRATGDLRSFNENNPSLNPLLQ